MERTSFSVDVCERRVCLGCVCDCVHLYVFDDSNKGMVSCTHVAVAVCGEGDNAASETNCNGPNQNAVVFRPTVFCAI